MLKTSPNENSLYTKSLLFPSLNFEPAGFYPNTMQYKGKVIPTQVQTQSSAVQLTNHKQQQSAKKRHQVRISKKVFT